MKKVDYSQILSGRKQPFKKGTWKHLQEAYTDVISDMLVAQIGDSYAGRVVYILYGCVNFVAGGNNNISAGAVFFGGEVYHHSGSVFTVSGGAPVILANRQFSNYTDPTADPVTFSDSSTGNVHNIRNVTFANGTVNTGTLSGNHWSNFSELVRLNYETVLMNSFTLPRTITFSNDKSILPLALISGGTLTLSEVNGIAGKKVLIHLHNFLGSPASFAVTSSSGSFITIGDTSIVVPPATSYILELVYLGNDGTDDIFYSKTLT